MEVTAQTIRTQESGMEPGITIPFEGIRAASASQGKPDASWGDPYDTPASSTPVPKSFEIPRGPDVNNASVPEIQQIAEYLKNMRFKHKAVGGVDEDDVLEHINRVTSMYNAALKSVQQRLPSQYETSVFEMHESINTEKRALQRAYEEKAENLEQDYSGKVNQLVMSLTQLNDMHEDMVAKAQKDAREILIQAQADADLIKCEAKKQAGEILDDAKVEALAQRRESYKAAQERAQEEAEHNKRIASLRDEAENIRVSLQRVLEQTSTPSPFDPFSGAVGL